MVNDDYKQIVDDVERAILKNSPFDVFGFHA